MLVVQDTPDYTVEVIDATADLPFSAILGLGSSSPTLNDTFLDSMVHSGLVDTKTFSIWLSGDSGGGEIVFGGVDPSFIGGSLGMQAFPAQPYPNTTDRSGLLAPWSSLELRNNSGTFIGLAEDALTDYAPVPAALSLMTDGLVVPTTVFNFFARKTNTNSTTLAVDCTWLNSTETVIFGFSHDSQRLMSIEVPLSAFIMLDTYLNGTVVQPVQCLLSMTNGTGEAGISILGTPFLRSAYVAWDHDDLSVGIAQARVIEPQDLASHSYNVTYLDAVTTLTDLVSSSTTQPATTGTFSVATLGVATASSTSSGTPKATNGACSVLTSLSYILLVETSVFVVLVL